MKIEKAYFGRKGNVNSPCLPKNSIKPVNCTCKSIKYHLGIKLNFVPSLMKSVKNSLIYTAESSVNQSCIINTLHKLKFSPKRRIRFILQPILIFELFGFKDRNGITFDKFYGT